jgi:hypothetical protein
MIASFVVAAALHVTSPACEQLQQIIEQETAIYMQCQQSVSHPAELSCDKNRDDMQANMEAYGRFCGAVTAH